MTCDHCKKPIQSSEPYFWSPDGGRWHPDCFEAQKKPGYAVRGMWMNTDGPFLGPEPEGALSPTSVEPDIITGGW